MPIYEYRCSTHGEIQSIDRADCILCPECRQRAKRVWSLKIDAASARHKGRWDPQVGHWVSSDKEFNDSLNRSAERESAELGMEVKLARCDARDNEGLAELQGISADERSSHLEAVKKTNFDSGRTLTLR